MQTLNFLKLAELNDLHRKLTALLNAGLSLERAGWPVRFDLTPGADIRLVFSMPMPACPEAPAMAQTDPTGAQMPEDAAEAAPGDLADTAGGKPSDIMPVAPIEVDPALAPEVLEMALPLPGGENDGAKLPPPPEPAKTAAGGGHAVPPPGGETTTNRKALPWAKAEDDLAIQMVAEGYSAAAIAAKLGRPIEGTRFRLYTKLKTRAQKVKTPAALAEPVAPSSAPRQFVPAAPIATTKSKPNSKPTPLPRDASPLDHHMAKISRKGGWTIEQDLDVMHLANLGWQVAEIALELQLDGAAVKDRFDLLTGFDKGSKRRAFGRPSVLDWLQTAVNAAATN